MSAVRLEQLIKETCGQWTQDVVAEPDLADRVLARSGHGRRTIRGRRPASRGRRPAIHGRRPASRFAIPLAAVVTVLVVGLVLALVTRFGNDAAPPVSTPAPTYDTSTHADPDHYRPTRLVAAGQVALAAFGTLPAVAPDETNQETNFTWHVYDAAKSRYVTVSWANVKVAPGLKVAAVLERSGAQRVGLLSLTTMKVTRWLPSAAPVSSVDWSPDARRLVLTTTGRTTAGGQAYTARTGFTIVDVATGRSTARSLPVVLPGSGGGLDTMYLENLSYQAVSWSRTGRLLWVQKPDISGKRDFYDLQGRRTAPPGHEGEEAFESPISPDGRLIATTGAEGYGAGPAVSVTDLASAKRQKVLILEHASVWADNGHVIGLACDPKACTGTGEFHNRYVLAGLDGSLVPLTGVGDSQSDQAWIPQFAPRWPMPG